MPLDVRKRSRRVCFIKARITCCQSKIISQNIKNKLHWFLDVALREDACKTHRGYAAENLARVCHVALNYLKGETNFKGGIRRKQKNAALD